MAESPTFSWQPGEQWPPREAVKWAASLDDSALAAETAQAFTIDEAIELTPGQTLGQVELAAAATVLESMLDMHVSDPARLDPAFMPEIAKATALKLEFRQRLGRSPGEI
jgi:hypothetical protein